MQLGNLCKVGRAHILLRLVRLAPDPLGLYIRAGHIESRNPVDRPLDLLSQHLVTRAIGGGFTRPEILAELQSTRAYAQITEAELDWVLDLFTRDRDFCQFYDQGFGCSCEDDFNVIEDIDIPTEEDQYNQPTLK